MTARAPEAPAAPQDLDAEASVVGAIMLDPRVLEELADQLQPEDFYRESNRIIYEVALRLRAQGRAIDNVTLAAALEGLKLLEKIGGRAALAAMQGSAPTAANAVHHARIVVAKARRRRAVAVLERGQALALDEARDPAEALQEAYETIYAVRGSFGWGESPKIERVGLHYEGSIPTEAGVVRFQVERLVEHRDEFTAELTMSYGPASSSNGRLSWGRVNLTGGTGSRGALVSLSKALNTRIQADWQKHLDWLFHEVVTRERHGEPVVVVAEHKPRSSNEYLLEPILPVGLPTVLYGPGGVGKSTIAAGMAFSVETGHPVFDGWTPLSGPVLILDWEGREEDWSERWEQLARGAGRSFPPLRYRPCRRRLRDDVEYISAEIAKHSVALVVVDSVSLAFGVSHTEQDPAEAALAAYAAIREVGNVTWLLIDHVTGERLENDQVATKAYGSVKKRDLARQMFHVSGSIEAGGEVQELVLTHTKANYSARMRPQGIAVERADGSLTFTLTSELSAPELVEKMPMTDRIRTLLLDGSKSPDRLRDLLGIDGKDKRAMENFRKASNRLIRYHVAARLAGGDLGLAVHPGQGSLA